MPPANDLILLAAAWLLYGLVHSLLASMRCKAWLARTLPVLWPYYRLGFNLFALVSVMPVLWLQIHADGPAIIVWHGAWRWLALGLSMAAGIGFLLSLRDYDLTEFIGLHQLHERAGAVRLHDAAEFHIGTFHRYVRHPWYFFSLVVLWTQDMNAPFLVMACALTLYLIVGTHYEERKLIAAFGTTYRRYMAHVPALLPLPWKHLSAAQAAALLAESKTTSSADRC